MRHARVVVMLLVLAGSVEAQELAQSFDQLRVLVKPGDTLTVIDGSGRPVRGKLATIAADS